MFTKIDKKVLIILVVILALAVLVGLAVYRYLTSPAPTVQNSAGGANTENTQNNSEVQLGVGGVSVGGAGDNSGLTICLDKCGDGVCQKPDSACDPKSLNCVCYESPEECPQDCTQ